MADLQELQFDLPELKFDESKQKESMATEGVSYLKEHPIKSVLQGLPETVTGKTMEQRAIENINSPDFMQSKQAPYDKFIPQARQAAENRIVGGQIIDMGSAPINALAGLILKGTGLLIKGAGEVASPMTNAIKNAFQKTIHGEEFLKGQAKNLRDMGQGLEDFLHKAYRDFYGENGLADVPVDSSKVDNILLENNVPNSTIKKIDEQIGKVDTISKAHQARQIIRSDLSKYAFDKDSIHLTPEDIKKETMSDLKDLMRDTTRPIDPEATAKLEDLDKFAYKEAYPRILRINRLISNDPLATEYPDTTGILNLFKSGLGKGQVRKLFSDSPDRIKQLDQYLVSPEYKKDVNDAVTASVKFSRGMKDFRNRQLQKKIGAGAVAGGGTYEIFKKLFGI